MVTRTAAHPTTRSITFLFTDVAGSTAAWELDGNAMATAMARHDDLVEEAVTASGGVLVRPRGEGDSRFAVFTRPVDAVAAAAQICRALRTERWPTVQPVEVRVAIHTGEADWRAGDYYGPAVNRAARLRGIAHPGQVLVSGATAVLVADGLPPGTALRDLGSHRLRDLSLPEHVYQLTAPDLPDEFPPLTSLDAARHNLPVALTSFVGRESEVAEVAKLLHTTRLLTVTGVGGAGKTRLALELAAREIDNYRDGVWLVQLDVVAEPSQVPAAVARALGIREQGSRPLLGSVLEFLAARQLLMVLDNCEHLVDAAAALSHQVLTAAPELSVLATSRQSLGVPGEACWAIPPLDAPDPKHLPTADELATYGAVRLFCDRAAAARPGLAIGPESMPALARICRRLDGIPLAIELAAARVGALSVAEIDRRLDDRFRLLARGARTAPPRHQTLAAAIDWSHDALPIPAQVLLRRLSVFAGGFLVEAAEGVCGGDGLVDEIWDVLTTLVATSVVVADHVDGATRYRLLETIRQYAAVRLADAGETDAIAARHMRWFLGMAEEAQPQLARAQGALRLDALEAEHDNLRSALRFGLEHVRSDEPLRLASALGMFWAIRGHYREGRRWIEEALERAPKTSVAVRVRALLVLSENLWQQGEFGAGAAVATEALEISRSCGDELGVAEALTALAASTQMQGDYERTRVLQEQALDAWRRSDQKQGYQGSLNIVLHNLGHLALNGRDLVHARSHYEEAVDVALAIGDDSTLVHHLNGLADVAEAEGRNDEAARSRQRALDLATRLGSAQGIIEAHRGLSWLAWVGGNNKRAAHELTEALGAATEFGDRVSLLLCLEITCWMAARDEPPERCALLIGAVDALRAAWGIPRQDMYRHQHDEAEDAARRSLGTSVFAVIYERGRRMALEEAVSEAKDFVKQMTRPVVSPGSAPG